MKKYLLIHIIFLLTLTASYSQSNVYHPFPDTTSVWSIDDYNIISYVKSHTRYGLKGDTIINGMNYKKIYIISSWDTTMITPYNWYYAAIREESKKIYARIGNIPEQVLYDFNLSVGDTMHYNYSIIMQGPDTFSRVVTAIDSIKLFNNEYRKRFCFANGINCYVPDTVVEGIGSIFWQGLFNPLVNNICTCGDEYTFSCFKEMDTVLYLNNVFCNYCFCGLSVDVDNVEAQKKTQIFPNPFSVETNLSIKENLKNATLIVYNALGQKMKQINNISGETIILHRDNLPSGLYFLSLTQDNKVIITDKFVITDN